jgi:moderate conductance mechanosensitive channel
MLPLAPALVFAAGANDPGLVEACGTKGNQSWACTTVFRITGDATAADVADALAKPIRIVFILVVAWIVVLVARAIINRFVRHLSGGVERLATLHPGVAFIDTSRSTPERAARRATTIGAVLRSVTSVLIWSIALLTILDEVGVNLAPLLAGAGIAGIALGFGAQTLVRDFLSGLFMFVEDQYGVGDVVDVGLATGTVEALSLRTTRLRDVQGVVWHVPNGEIHRVGNKSMLWSRALIDVAIRYDADVDAAIGVIQEAANEIRRDEDFGHYILDEPDVLGIESLSPDRVVIRVVVRTRPQEEARVERALRARIKVALEAAGIAVPTV